jgi:hypothetical protein
MWALMNILTPHPPREVKAGLGAYTERSSKQVCGCVCAVVMAMEDWEPVV